MKGDYGMEIEWLGTEVEQNCKHMSCIPKSVRYGGVGIGTSSGGSWYVRYVIFQIESPASITAPKANEYQTAPQAYRNTKIYSFYYTKFRNVLWKHLQIIKHVRVCHRVGIALNMSYVCMSGTRTA